MKVYTHSKYSYVRVAEIPKSELRKIDFALCKQPTETLASFYNRQTDKPAIITNGGFFAMSTGATTFNYVTEGETKSYNDSYQWGMGIIGDDDLQYGWLKAKEWRDFIGGYPILLDNKRKCAYDYASEINYKARRTAIGYNDNAVFLVCVETPGMNFPELQNLMLDVGCKYAINLDGGGSTKMLHNGVSVTKDATNRPVDNVVAIYLKSEKTTETIKRNEKTMISCFKGKFRVTSPYGNRTLNGSTTTHNGIDLVALEDTAVYAPCDGVIGASTIITNKSDRTWEWGNFVRLDTSDGYSIYMCHMASRAVSVGQRVKKGDKLGVMGNTGYSTGPHTHFEVRKYGTNTAIDPSVYSGIPNKVGTYVATPKATDNIDIIYQVYSDNKWWDKVTNYNTYNYNGYAGVDMHPIQALKVSLSEGSVQYRAHTIDGKWWDWVTDSVGNGYNSYAGVIGKNIDAIQVKLIGDIAKTHEVRYRVSSSSNPQYLDWVTGANETGYHSYAGIMGAPIDKIQMVVEAK